MTIQCSSKSSLKFLTEKKRQELYRIMDEYSTVMNIFILLFWENEISKKELAKEITRLPESWLCARMRQNTVREVLGMFKGAKISAGTRKNRRHASLLVSLTEQGNQVYNVTFSQIGVQAWTV